jgi:sirohydrochlorin cobaltochelatase
MTSSLTEALEALLGAGPVRAGQVEMRRAGAAYELRHLEDAGLTQLQLFQRYEDAREIAQYDEGGAFRPLKTAPNLRRGWLLRLPTVRDVHLALDYLYPAMLGVWRDQAAGRLRAVPLRETLGRQSGMYAVTRKLTDEQAQATIADFCRSDTGCLKRILWEIAPGQPLTSLPAAKFSAAHPGAEFPLLCHEACNLLVARAREVVKNAGPR